jgi:hypothetical protein
MSIEVGTKVRILDAKAVLAPSYLNGMVGEVVRTEPFHNGFDVTFEDGSTWAFRRENVEVVGEETTYTIDQIREAFEECGFLTSSANFVIDALKKPRRRVVIEGTVRLEVDKVDAEDYGRLSDLLLDYHEDAEFNLTSKEVS